MACVLHWDVEDVVTWLDQCLQLPPDEVASFKEARIDGQRLVDLTEEDLSSLRISESAHRLRLLSHVTVFRSQLGRPLLLDGSSGCVATSFSSSSIFDQARGVLPTFGSSIVQQEPVAEPTVAPTFGTPEPTRTRTPRGGQKPQRCWSTGGQRYGSAASPISSVASQPANLSANAATHTTRAKKTSGVAAPSKTQIPADSLALKLAFESPAHGRSAADDLAPQTPLPSAFAWPVEEPVCTYSTATPSTADSGEPYGSRSATVLSMQHFKSGGSSSSRQCNPPHVVEGNLASTEEPVGATHDGLQATDRASSADAANWSARGGARMRSKSPDRRSSPKLASCHPDQVNSEFGVDRRPLSAPFSSSAGRDMAPQFFRVSSSPGPAAYQPKAPGHAILNKHKRGATPTFSHDARNTWESIRRPCHESSGTARLLPQQRDSISCNRFGTAARFPQHAHDKSPGPTAYTPRHRYRSDFK